MQGEKNILIIKRFNGEERYKVKSASWNFYLDNNLKTFCVYLKSDESLEIGEDTGSFFSSLNWELNYIDSKLKEEDLVKGFYAEIPEAYDEKKEGWITNFYYSSHEGTDKNSIKIIDRFEDKLLLELSGEVIDPNYYDGSKPNAVLLVQTWFDKKEGTKRSMN
ncbi:MAG: hypothetical protein AAFO07_02720 [Bacteroidota bacterium]